MVVPADAAGGYCIAGEYPQRHVNGVLAALASMRCKILSPELEPILLGCTAYTRGELARGIPQIRHIYLVLNSGGDSATVRTAEDRLTCGCILPLSQPISGAGENVLSALFDPLSRFGHQNFRCGGEGLHNCV